MMKRIVAIGFLIVLTSQFVGFYAYFGSRLLAIRKEMRAALATLPEEKLEKIVISAAEFKKIDSEENEIELSGKMYDIAKVVKADNAYILFALHDEHEDSLLSMLDEMIKRSTNDKKPVPSEVVQFLALVFVVPQSFEFLHPFTPSFLNTEYTKSSKEFDLMIDAPPPRG
ncbi:MAG: hypothetical protein HOP30_05220 [Cyclobacteriaceae bacterium]|nr:hypothetical protein [Cyclobacteriaceae bacterium]